MNFRPALAVLLSGVTGTLANAVAAAAFVRPGLWVLALAPGRYAVAILLMAAVPLLYRLVPGAWGAVVALVFLTLTPSLLAKLALGTLTVWPVVLALNFVYALAALVVYRLVLGNRP
jgi:hypothetical protein